MEDTNLDTPPEVNEELDSAAESLTPQEVQAINTLRQRGSQVTMEIGNLEIRKARLLSSMSALEEQAQAILMEAGKRLGIPDGQPWHVNPDGTIRLVPGQGIPPGM